VGPFPASGRHPANLQLRGLIEGLPYHPPSGGQKEAYRYPRGLGIRIIINELIINGIKGPFGPDGHLGFRSHSTASRRPVGAWGVGVLGDCGSVGLDFLLTIPLDTKVKRSRIMAMAFIEQAAAIEPRAEATEMELGWLAGFIEGDGCFTAQRRVATNSITPIFTATQRYDDLSLLTKVKEIFGVGYFYLRNGVGNKAPQIAFLISGIPRVVKYVIPVLDRCAFYGKKGLEYNLWREMTFLADEWRKRNKPAAVVDKIEWLYFQIQGIKEQAIPGELEPRNRELLESALRKLNSEARPTTEPTYGLG